MTARQMHGLTLNPGCHSGQVQHVATPQHYKGDAATLQGG
jgi:hypothetical protein